MAIYTKPKSHQIEGAKFLIKKKVGIIGAKTGKGKTLIVLACVHQYVNNKKDYAIVFAPPKAYEAVWPREIKKHSDMKAITLDAVKERYKKEEDLKFLFDYDIILAKYTHVKAENYSILNKLIPGRITVYDEAHKLKNPETKMVKLMTNLTYNARAKWAITATAMGNSLLDLWGLMAFLEPRLFGTESQFKKRYCIEEEKVIGWKKRYGRMMQDTRLVVVDYKNLDELKDMMKNYMWFVASDLKVKFHAIMYEMNMQEELAYLQASDGRFFVEKLNTKTGKVEKKKKGFAQRLPDIQRVVDGTYDIGGEKTVGFRSSKYMQFLDTISKFLSKGESVIFFAEYIDTFDMLYSLLKEDLPTVPLYRISGARMEYKEGQAQLPCIILSTIGGTESLNLKFANHVLCFSVPFNVLAFIQLVGRITRMDSDHLDDLNVYIPICENNIDKYKYAYLESNAAVINNVLGEDANLPKGALANMKKGMLDDMRKQIVWRKKQVKRKKK